MKYNVYNLTFNNDWRIEPFVNRNLPPHLANNLLVIEREIIKEFLEAQKNKVGIKSLGYELQSNKVLIELFTNNDQNYSIVKATENKRAFFKLFINSISNNAEKDIYFFILQRSFGLNSKLVDRSFIHLDQIKKDLDLFFTSFRLLRPTQRIVFIEFTGFNDYFVESIDDYKTKYSKLHKKNN